MTLLLAIRNLSRHRRRTLITAGGIGLGVACLIFLRGFIHGVQGQMIHNLTSTLTGDLQVGASAIPPTIQEYLRDPARVEEVVRQTPGVTGLARRVEGSGVVASPSGSIIAVVTGVIPSEETQIGSNYPLTEGRPLGAGDDHGVFIGEKMRDLLKVHVGDKVVVTVQDAKGELTGEAFSVIGTFETGNDQMDNTFAFLTLASAQHLFAAPGRISKLVLRTSLPPDQVAASFGTQLPDTPVRTWRDILPMFSQMMGFQNGMTLIIMVVVLTMVAAGTMNTIMMSILERTREFGVLLAIGTTPARLMALVMMETVFITCMGIGIGFLVGLVATCIASWVGIDLSHFIHTMGNFMVGHVVYPQIDWSYTGLFMLVILIANLLVSLYPSWHVGQLTPLGAMRKVG